ncbi:MAG: Cof-type HAD-IIB family hydrolase [Acholeplasmatales bacterium]|nr:Cof-type HAD-IIB family hydrolase [Acholeplasmatales bacterium]
MNRLFLFDIDGTLAIGSDIPKSAKLALKKLRENGDLVLLSSGRCIGSMKPILDQIEVDGAICNNGGYAFIGDDVLFESEIDKNTINKMIDDGLHLSYLSRDSFFRTEENQIFYDFADTFKIPTAKLRDESALNEKIYSMCIQDYDADKIDASQYNLRAVRVCKLGYDVMNMGINKASALPSIRNRYKDYKIIAFGDNLNDIEILKAADISIAMGQAPTLVKEASTYVTKKPFEDGILYAINEYLGGF